MSVRIQITNLDTEDIQDLLTEHLDSASQQQASHAYSIDKLRARDVHIFAARDDKNELMGIAGLKLLDSTHGEIKSVRTHSKYLRKGVSTALMQHLSHFAAKKGLTRLSLETHPTPVYAAARALYERLGFQYCDAFADYENSETSIFMTKEL